MLQSPENQKNSPFQLLSSELPVISGGKWVQFFSEREVNQVFFDSRKYFSGTDSLFIAFRGTGHDGHRFVEPLYALGVRQFAITSEGLPMIDADRLPEANILLVDSPVKLLQQLAAHHRAAASIPVIGITGSNGKTTVKEWLYEVLSPDHSIIKSPGSYNSQIGVPLSVWPIRAGHTLGIFEAGISGAGEMDALREVIRPTIGVFTNLLAAHDEGFESREEKAAEKAKLFSKVEKVIHCADDPIISAVVRGLPVFTWGTAEENDVCIRREGNVLRIRTATGAFEVVTKFNDPASIQNLSHVITVMLLLGYSPEIIASRIHGLRRLPMRLEMKEGVNGCNIIDDTYSNDLSSLKLALDFLRSQKHSRPGPCTVILSDLEQTGMDDQEWLLEVRHLLAGSPVDEFVGIGPVLGAVTEPIGPLNASSGYADVDAFLEVTALQGWKDRVILVKGGRSFRFERIVEQLHRRIHGTVMEVDLVALARNLGVFRSGLRPGTRLMVMVKAFAYGSGSGEVARFLQHHHVDYLGVAYTDEGVALRNQGVDLPVMIMNPAPESAGLLAAHNLEPAFYSREVAETMLDRLRGSAVRIHLKIDTGMHRLGFEESDLDWLCNFLDRNRHLTVASVYSHLAASESSVHDDFTAVQADRFRQACQRISATLGYQPLRHLLNTSGILRHHEHHYDMVRLGIGLYGVAPTFGQHRSLEQVVTLKTIISQVKEIGPGETVGYGRHGKVAPGTRIGTVSIGYADGYSRAFSNGKGKMLVHGKLAPVVGNVCMDMTMIDLTGIDASAGDEVIIFGRDLPPAEVASWINTIPYELLTAAGERVRRIFHSAS